MTHPSRRASHRGSSATATVLSVLLATGLAACGDDEPAAGSGPSPSAADGPAPGGPDASEAPDPDGPDGPEASQDPEDVWPDGQVVDIEVASVRVPAAWSVDPMPLEKAFKVRVPRRGTILVAAYPSFGDLTAADEVDIPLEEIEQELRDSDGDKENFEILEHRDVNGVEMAQAVHGSAGSFPTRTFMVEHADDRVALTFMMRAEFPPEDPVIDKVLSTVEWHEERD